MSFKTSEIAKKLTITVKEEKSEEVRFARKPIFPIGMKVTSLVRIL